LILLPLDASETFRLALFSKGPTWQLLTLGVQPPPGFCCLFLA
jgi:hypothetical protein